MTYLHDPTRQIRDYPGSMSHTRPRRPSMSQTRFSAGDHIRVTPKLPLETETERTFREAGKALITGVASDTRTYVGLAVFGVTTYEGVTYTLNLNYVDVEHVIEVMQPAEHLYEKCAECELFVEPNDERDRQMAQDPAYAATLAEWLHSHRGDEEDTLLDESHEPKPSGMRANLATWKAYGPREMRVRFTNPDEVRWPVVLVTDDGKDTTFTTHDSEEEALECLRENFDPEGEAPADDLIQFVCDQGVIVYLHEI